MCKELEDTHLRIFLDSLFVQCYFEWWVVQSVFVIVQLWSWCNCEICELVQLWTSLKSNFNRYMCDLKSEACLQPCKSSIKWLENELKLRKHLKPIESVCLLNRFMWFEWRYYGWIWDYKVHDYLVLFMQSDLSEGCIVPMCSVRVKWECKVVNRAKIGRRADF